MAGYLGTKAVLLSTTAADVIGNAEIGGDLTVGGNITSTGIDDNASSTAITIDGSQNVGIGTSSVSTGKVNIVQGSSSAVTVLSQSSASGDGGTSNTAIRSTNLTGSAWANTRYDAYTHTFGVGGSASANSAVTIDSSGNLLVGKTSANSDIAGFEANASGFTAATRDNGTVFVMDRLTSDGGILSFRKDGSTVGSIGTTTNSYNYFAGPNTGIFCYNAGVGPTSGSGVLSDNAKDLGALANRWDDIYATNGTIQTSDRNEKQDIEALSDAEQRVAQACKGLLRKFRWKDAVAEKGDDARIHFGIIAQDLQDAFAAEGLDAGRYAMFISSTWWETQTDVPAVEAVAEVLDDEGNVVTEAVEAKEAYTRTDTYETQAEAPEGATERTRLGVRYPELLAFIIGVL